MVITYIHPTELLSVEIPNSRRKGRFNSFDDPIDSHTKIENGEYEVVGTVTKQGVNFDISNYIKKGQSFYKLLFDNGCFMGGNKYSDLLIIKKSKV